MGVRKDIYDQGGVNVVAIWDVSEYAKQNNIFDKKAKVDDYLRNIIGYRKCSTGEVHTLSGEEMLVKVNCLLAKFNQPLPIAKLSSYQYNVAEEILTEFRDKKIILADLCARFGKTIWSGAVGVELGADIIVIASYVKTVFTSFATDLTSFQQFANYEHIDMGEDNYIEEFKKAKKDKKKVFLYLSLCNGSNRQKRIDWLCKQAGTKLLIVDEADFGAYKEKQAVPLTDKVSSFNWVILMTGTNADRAATYWPIEHIINVTYPELLVQKKIAMRHLQNSL